MRVTKILFIFTLTTLLIDSALACRGGSLETSLDEIGLRAGQELKLTLTNQHIQVGTKEFRYLPQAEQWCLLNPKRPAECLGRMVAGASENVGRDTFVHSHGKTLEIVNTKVDQKIKIYPVVVDGEVVTTNAVLIGGDNQYIPGKSKVFEAVGSRPITERNDDGDAKAVGPVYRGPELPTPKPLSGKWHRISKGCGSAQSYEAPAPPIKTPKTPPKRRARQGQA